MTRGIYDILNDVKIDTSKYKEKEISDKEKDRAKRKFSRSLEPAEKKRQGFIKPALAAGLGLMIIGGAMNTNVRAELADKLKTLNYSIREALYIPDQGQSYELNQSFTMGDFKVKATDMVLSEDSLIINYLVQPPTSYKAKGNLSLGLEELFINGEKVKVSASTVSGDTLDQGVESTVAVYHFENTLEDYLVYDGYIQLKNLENMDKTFKTNPINIEFNGSRDELSGRPLIIKDKLEIQTDLGLCQVEKIKLHPIMSQIYISSPRAQDLTAKLTLKDGSEINFMTGSSKPNDETGKVDHILYSKGIGDPQTKLYENSGPASLQLYTSKEGLGGGNEKLGEAREIFLANPDPVYSQVLSETIDIDDGSLTLTDMVMDENHIQASLHINSTHIKDNDPKLAYKSSKLLSFDDIKISVNGKDLESSYQPRTISHIENGSQTSLFNINFEEKIYLEEENTIKLSFIGLTDSEEYKVADTYEMEFSVSREDLGSLDLALEEDQPVEIETNLGKANLTIESLHPYEPKVLVNFEGDYESGAIPMVLNIALKDGRRAVLSNGDDIRDESGKLTGLIFTRYEFREFTYQDLENSGTFKINLVEVLDDYGKMGENLSEPVEFTIKALD